MRGVHLWLNGGALFRILIETELGRWQIGQRGVLMWFEWREEMGGAAATAEEAVRIAGEYWGAGSAAALRLAVESGFDPRQLGALDLAQSFPQAPPSNAWPTETVETVDLMFAAGADVDVRVSAALTHARRSGRLSNEDIQAAGFGGAVFAADAETIQPI